MKKGRKKHATSLEEEFEFKEDIHFICKIFFDQRDEELVE